MSSPRPLSSFLVTIAWMIAPVFVWDGVGIFDGNLLGKWYWTLFLSIGTLLWFCWLRPNPVLKVPRWLAVWAAFGLWQWIDIPTAVNFGQAIDISAHTVVILTFGLFLANTEISFHNFRRFLLLATTLGIGGALCGIFFRFNPFYLDFMSSAFGFRNWTSVFLIAVIPCFLLERSRWSYFLIPLSIYVAIAYRTRSAWLMLVFMFLALIFIFWRTRSVDVKRALVKLTMSFGLAVFAVIFIPNKLEWRSKTPYKESVQSIFSIERSNGRDQLWKLAGAIFADHPWLGVGPGNLKVHMSAYATRASVETGVVNYTGTAGTVFNDYVQQAVELGIFGFLLMLALGAMPFWFFFRLFKGGLPRAKLEPIVFLICPMALSLDALVDYPFLRVETLLLFCATLILVGKTIGTDWKVERSKRGIRFGLTTIAAVLALVLGGLALSQHFEIRFEKRKDGESALQAYRFWPWHLKWGSNWKLMHLIENSRMPRVEKFVDERLKDWPYAPTSYLAAAAYCQASGDFLCAMDHYRTTFLLPGKPHPVVLELFSRFLGRADFPPDVNKLKIRELDAYLEEFDLDPTLSTLQKESTNWDIAQSWIDEWRGFPIFSANWSGSYRPYKIDLNLIKPLLPPQVHIPADLDFMSPTALSDRFVLFSARRKRGSDAFSIFLFDSRRGRLENLTPGWTDDNGDLCVDRSSRRIAWKTNREKQNFGGIQSDGSLGKIGEWPTAFSRCQWLDSSTLVGVTNADWNPVLWRCTIKDSVNCEKTRELEGFSGMTRFFETLSGEKGFIAFAPGENQRRPYLWADKQWKIVGGLEKVEGDIVDFDGKTFRTGTDGGFSLQFVHELEKPQIGVVHFQRTVNGEIYGIYSDEVTPRTVARFEEGKWKPLRASLSLKDEPARPHLRSFSNSLGDEVRGYEYGAEDAKKVVLWWHGGPRESISPRYNPYFHFLNQQGISVFALNYPGSTGRGRNFESIFTEERIESTARAAINFLRHRGARQIISWSVSTGSRFQDTILKKQIPVSAMIDQAGFLDPGLSRKLAKKMGTRYFGIHGRFDHGNPDVTQFDFVYEGGHDLTQLRDFEELQRRLLPFFKSLR